MSFDFSTLITDRTQADVTAGNDKGTYNADDLNRVTAAMEYLNDTLRNYGYVTGYQRLEVPHDTTGGDSLLPDGYTELSYIQSSGTQYIDTGVTATESNNITVELDVLCLANTGASQVMIAVNGALGGGQWFGIYSGKWGFGSSATYSEAYSTRIQPSVKWTSSGGSYTLNGLTYSRSCTLPSGGTTLLFGTASGYGIQANLYSCKVYDNGALVRDFVPCISDSGAIGLYDIVEEQFYTNAGTGVFTAGDVVDMPITGDESDTEYDAYTWYEYDLPTKGLMESYLANVLGLYEVILPDPELPTTMEKLTYQGANQIEQALVTLNTAIKQIVSGFSRSNSFAFWSGNRPFPTTRSDRGRNWAQLDAMETSWSNWQLATWYLLLYGNLQAEGAVN